MKFKIGQIVKCIETETNQHITVGKLYVVTDSACNYINTLCDIGCECAYKDYLFIDASETKNVINIPQTPFTMCRIEDNTEFIVVNYINNYLLIFKDTMIVYGVFSKDQIFNKLNSDIKYWELSKDYTLDKKPLFNKVPETPFLITTKDSAEYLVIRQYAMGHEYYGLFSTTSHKLYKVYSYDKKIVVQGEDKISIKDFESKAILSNLNSGGWKMKSLNPKITIK